MNRLTMINSILLRMMLSQLQMLKKMLEVLLLRRSLKVVLLPRRKKVQVTFRLFHLISLKAHRIFLHYHL